MIQGRAVHVGENQFGSRGAGSDETQHGGYGVGGEIVGDAFPEKNTALGWVEAGLAQNSFQGLAIKINLHEAEVGRFAFDGLGQVGALGCESLRMINLKNSGGAKFGDAKCPAVEAR